MGAWKHANNVVLTTRTVDAAQCAGTSGYENQLRKGDELMARELHAALETVRLEGHRWDVRAEGPGSVTSTLRTYLVDIADESNIAGVVVAKAIAHAQRFATPSPRQRR
jgi:hypothetical protein